MTADDVQAFDHAFCLWEEDVAEDLPPDTGRWLEPASVLALTFALGQVTACPREGRRRADLQRIR